MSTVKPDRLRGFIPKCYSVTPDNEPPEIKKQSSVRRGARGRPALGENRRAPLLLHHLRPLAQLLSRARRHLPAALANDCETQEARVCAAIAELEGQQAKPRRVLGKQAYRVRFPGAEPVSVHGMVALGALVKRSPNYVQNKLSQGGGVARLPKQHPETGNPDYIVVERLGTKIAPKQ